MNSKREKAPDLVLRVEMSEEGRRLDTFLSLHHTELSRSHLKRLIQEGLVLVNEREAKPGHEVRSGDWVSLWLPSFEERAQLTPEPMVLDVLYEDEDILVLNKAPGVVVHPGAGHGEGTLVHGLLAHCPKLALQGAPQRPGIVHRLDRDTSGALVVAKSEFAYLELIRQFKEHRVHKEYRALVYGRMAQAQGEIRTCLDRHPVDRKRMAVVQNRGREAISSWQVESEWGEVSLLRVTIQTGRTHQIRVHLSHLQHPIVGDETYGGGKRRVRSLKLKALQQVLQQVDRQMLHAWRLALEHPRSRGPLSFIAPLPPDFSRVLEGIRGAI